MAQNEGTQGTTPLLIFSIVPHYSITNNLEVNKKLSHCLVVVAYGTRPSPFPFPTERQLEKLQISFVVPIRTRTVEACCSDIFPNENHDGCLQILRLHYWLIHSLHCIMFIFIILDSTFDGVQLEMVCIGGDLNYPHWDRQLFVLSIWDPNQRCHPFYIWRFLISWFSPQQEASFTGLETTSWYWSNWDLW